MKPHISQRILITAVSVFLVPRMPHVITAGQCESRRTNYDKALKGHTFENVKVTMPTECVIRCEIEVRCQSFNYVMADKTCELNNRTKEARPEDYVADPTRIYMTIQFNRAPLGSIPELPAESCLEIKASEGEEVVSGYNWLDSHNTGEAIHSYCYFGTQEKPFYWTLSGTDSQLNLRGAAKFMERNGKKVLYLDGTYGTYAETSAVPFQKTDLTIAMWTNLVSPITKRQVIYADWSSPWQFRFDILTDGRLCFQGRRNVGGISDMITVCTGSSDIVDADVWRHVAFTWGRTDRKVRLYINGDVKREQVVSDNPVLDLKMSGHSVYDIGLKRDSATTTHAYFSDLIIFTHELSGTELKNELFFNHAFQRFV